MLTKLCNKCGEIKPHSEFYKSNRTKDGYATICKLCRKPIEKAYFKNNRGIINMKRCLRARQQKTVGHLEKVIGMNQNM